MLEDNVESSLRNSLQARNTPIGKTPKTKGSGTFPPLIGLPGRRAPGGELGKLPKTMSRLPVEVFFYDYTRRVAEAGGLPILISLETDSAEVMKRLDGLVLPGGPDIDPALYGAEPEVELMDPEADRDAQELGLLDAAASEGVPVLGICRGLQLVNVWSGGTLHQNVPEHGCFDDPPDSLQHEVTFAPNSRLAEVYGESVQVNSLHHQTVDRLGDGLKVTASAPDGTVEGLESEDAPMVAVQWHPELLGSHRPIFDWFINWTQQARK